MTQLVINKKLEPVNSEVTSNVIPNEIRFVFTEDRAFDLTTTFTDENGKENLTRSQPDLQGLLKSPDSIKIKKDISRRVKSCPRITVSQPAWELASFQNLVHPKENLVHPKERGITKKKNRKRGSYSPFINHMRTVLRPIVKAQANEMSKKLKLLTIEPVTTSEQKCGSNFVPIGNPNNHATNMNKYDIRQMRLKNSLANEIIFHFEQVRKQSTDTSSGPIAKGKEEVIAQIRSRKVKITKANENKFLSTKEDTSEMKIYYKKDLLVLRSNGEINRLLNITKTRASMISLDTLDGIMIYQRTSNHKMREECDYFTDLDNFFLRLSIINRLAELEKAYICKFERCTKAAYKEQLVFQDIVQQSDSLKWLKFRKPLDLMGGFIGDFEEHMAEKENISRENGSFSFYYNAKDKKSSEKNTHHARITNNKGMILKKSYATVISSDKLSHAKFDGEFDDDDESCMSVEVINNFDFVEYDSTLSDDGWQYIL